MDIENIRRKSVCISEIIKWCIVTVLFVVSVIGNYLCRNYNICFRSIVVMCIVAVAMYIVSITDIGRSLVLFGKEAHIELRQIVWPTYREGLYTTIVVVAVTVVVSLVLWGLDAVVVHIISFGLRL